jgi:hypothetical protein
MHALPPPVCALSVHTEFNVCVLPITQRPTANVAKQRIKVTDLFTTLF